MDINHTVQWFKISAKIKRMSLQNEYQDMMKNVNLYFVTLQHCSDNLKHQVL